MSVRRQAGFSFIEMLTVVAIIALIGAMVVPAMQSLVRNTRIASLADYLQNSLALARSTAVTQRRTTVWMRTTAPEGWQVRLDNTTGPLLAEHRVMSPEATYVIIPTVTPGTALTQVRFDPSGLVKRNDSGTATDIEFRVCSPKVTDETGRSVRISRLGRLVSGRHPNAAVCNP